MRFTRRTTLTYTCEPGPPPKAESYGLPAAEAEEEDEEEVALALAARGTILRDSLELAAAGKSPCVDMMPVRC